MFYTCVSFSAFLSVLLLILPLGWSRAPRCPSMSIPPVTVNVIEENKQLTRQLNRHLKLWQLNKISGFPVENRYTSNFSLTVLNLASDVVKSACPNHFVPHRDLIDGALNVFTFLHDNAGDVRYFEDPMRPSMYERIASALTACQKTIFPKGYYFSSDEDDKCPTTASTIRQLCRINTDYDLDMARCQTLQLRHGRRADSEQCFQNTNLIIDIVWSIVEIVHVACFNEFQQRNDISAFHMFEQALEELFTIKIRKYWYQSPLSTEMYHSILHPNIRQQIFNLEMCLEGINQMIPNKIPGLQRPAYPLLLYGKRRRKRNSDKINENV